MRVKSENSSSSSEDETSIEALKEATDLNFLKKSFFKEDSKDKEEKKVKFLTNIKQDTEEDATDCYEDYGISQSCKNFIAKKLNHRLDKDIILEDRVEQKNLISQLDSNGKSDPGIKLFSSSHTVLNEVDEVVEQERPLKKRKSKDRFNDKLNRLKCEEVAVDSKLIMSQEETKHWTTRKLRKIFKYKKDKNGVFKEL